MRRVSLAASSLLALALLAPHAAAETPFAWQRFAEVDTVRIRTFDDDGPRRARTINLLVHEGHGYVRAGGASRWDRTIDAHPEVELEIEGVWYALRAARVPRGPLYDAVKAGMRAKYGAADAWIGLVRRIGGTPRILRLDPRP